MNKNTHQNVAPGGAETSRNRCIKVSKCAKIRNRYNQVPHLIQDTNGIVTHSQLDTTNESQKVNPFPAGEHKAQRHNKHKPEKTQMFNKRSTALERSVKIFYWRA